jgi:chromosome segregation ATPase
MMGIERIVTDAMVFEIADSLAASGQKVTNRAIWSAIGGGSMTTISQALRHWKEKQVLQVAQPVERAPLPVALVDILHHATAQLWEAAQAETKAELEQLAQATNARIAEAHAERDDTLAELQATVEELDQVRADLNAVQTELNSKAQQLASCIAEIASLKAELNAQTLATTEATHRAETVEAVRVELQARAEQLTHLLEHEQAVRLAENNQAKTESTKAMQQLTKAQKEAENARIAEQTCQAHLDAAAREIEALKAQLREERNTAKKSAELAAELKGRLFAVEEVKPKPAKVVTESKVEQLDAEQLVKVTTSRKTKQKAAKDIG